MCLEAERSALTSECGPGFTSFHNTAQDSGSCFAEGSDSASVPTLEGLSLIIVKKRPTSPNCSRLESSCWSRHLSPPQPKVSREILISPDVALFPYPPPHSSLAQAQLASTTVAQTLGECDFSSSLLVSLRTALKPTSTPVPDLIPRAAPTSLSSTGPF